MSSASLNESVVSSTATIAANILDHDDGDFIDEEVRSLKEAEDESNESSEDSLHEVLRRNFF